MGVFFRSRQSGRRGNAKTSFGREGRRLGGDEPDWFAGASGAYDHDRSLYLLLRKQEELSEVSRRRGEEGRRARRENHGHEVWRQQSDADARLGSFGRARFDAGHDGYDFEPRTER